MTIKYYPAIFRLFANRSNRSTSFIKSEWAEKAARRRKALVLKNTIEKGKRIS